MKVFPLSGQNQMEGSIPSPLAAWLWWRSGGKPPTDWHQYRQPLWRLCSGRYLISIAGEPLRDLAVMRRFHAGKWQYRRETPEEQEDSFKGEIW
jgi:hypothetical protein